MYGFVELVTSSRIRSFKKAGRPVFGGSPGSRHFEEPWFLLWRFIFLPQTIVFTAREAGVRRVKVERNSQLTL